jgi:CubicO group peptidase (beta-lactamase class C family)
MEGKMMDRNREDGHEEFEALCTTISARMNDLGVPGAATGVLYRGVERTAGFGVTSVENPLPVTPETLFQIGSITKTFVGTAVMRLVEQGKLELDRPVRTYLGDLELASDDAAQRVTMRHLVTHTAGWVGDYFDDFGPGDDALATMVAKMRDLEQLTPVGEVWSYNNAAFYLAGRVIEVVTGETFEAAIRNLVIQPLGMSMSYLFPVEMISHRFVVGHHVDDDAVRVARPWAIGRASNPAGGVISNVVDLLRYARFHLGDGRCGTGEQLLSAASISTMQSPQAEAGSGLEATGIAWGIRTVAGERVVAHGGGTKGQVTNLTLVPARGFAITVLSNANRGGGLIRAAVARALDSYLGLKEQDLVPVPMAGAALREYTGVYKAALDDLEIGIDKGGTRLVVAETPRGGFPTPDTPPGPASPPFPLAFHGADLVFVPEGDAKGSRGEFLRDGAGEIEWFRFGGRIHRRQAV